MNNGQTVFLNGRHYDALTGKVVKPRTDSAETQRRTINHVSRHIDGMYRTPTQKSQPKIHKVRVDSIHDVAPHINRLTQHSKTLMRSAVKNPKVSKLKSHQESAKAIISNSVGSIGIAQQTAAPVATNRTRHIHRDSFSHRLNEKQHHPKVEQPQPVAHRAHPQQPNLASYQAPEAAKAEPLAVAQNFQPQNVQTSANSQVHLNNIERLNQIDSHKNIDDILSEASLRLSDSHQPISNNELRFYDRLADKLRISVKMLFAISIVLFIIIFVLISSYFFSSNISMMIADSETGVHGIIPSYTPPGYSLGKISYTKGSPSGTINMVYSKGNTGYVYHLQEETTTWDNTALVNSVVMPSVGDQYKTYQVGGRSVYIYSDTAVWIDAGTYFVLSNGARLTPQQITQIVSTT